MEFPEVVRQWGNDVLVWVGFGTLAGLLAKAIMPGRDPGGAVTTVALGVGGTVVGSGTVMFFTNGTRVTPLSPLGFVVATGGAFILLFFYRLLAGYFFREGEEGRLRQVRKSPGRRRVTVLNED